MKVVLAQDSLWIDHLPPPKGYDHWGQLEAAYTILLDGVFVTAIPGGGPYDGASVPKLWRGTIGTPWQYPFDRMGTLHDEAYKGRLLGQIHGWSGPVYLTAAEADEMFRAGLAAGGVGRCDRTRSYWGVRLYSTIGPGHDRYPTLAAWLALHPDGRTFADLAAAVKED